MSLKILGKESLVYGFGHVVSRLITFLLLPIYTHSFSPREYGTISLAYAFIGFASVLYRYGMDTALMKFSVQSETSERKSYISSIYILQFCTSLIFSGILFLLKDIITEPILGVTDSSLMAVISILIFLDNLWNHHLLILRSENKSTTFISFSLLNVIMTMLLNVIFVVKWDYGISGVFFANLIASASVFILSSPVILKRLSFLEINLDILKDVIKFGMPFLPAGLLTMVMELSNRYILDMMEGVEAVGLFSAGYKLGIFALVLVMGFNMGWTPYFLRRIKEGDSKKEFSIITTIFLGLLGFVIFTTTIWISELIRFSINGNYIIGKEFWSAEKIVPVVLFGYFFFGTYVLQLPGIYANNITNWVPIFRAIGAISNISFNIILIPQYGVIGSAWATVLSFFIMSAAVFLKLNKNFNVKYNWLGVLFPVLSMLVLFFDIKNILLQFAMPFVYIMVWYLFIINKHEKNAIRGIFSW
jgi:O-antigen/teichoic acid export membrane protein